MSQSQPDLLPHDNAVGEIYRVNISFTAVTILVIGLRLIVRAFVVKHVAVDDYLMVGAGLFSTAFSVMVIVGKSRRIKCRYRVMLTLTRHTVRTWETHIRLATRPPIDRPDQKGHPGRSSLDIHPFLISLH